MLAWGCLVTPSHIFVVKGSLVHGHNFAYDVDRSLFETCKTYTSNFEAYLDVVATFEERRDLVIAAKNFLRVHLGDEFIGTPMALTLIGALCAVKAGL